MVKKSDEKHTRRYYLIMISKNKGKIEGQMIEFIKPEYRKIAVETFRKCHDVVYLECRDFDFFYTDHYSAASLNYIDDDKMPAAVNKIPI